MKRNIAYITAMAAVLAACNSAPASLPREPFTLNSVRFGQSFIDVLVAIAPYSFSPYSVRECSAEIALRGYFAGALGGGVPFLVQQGVPFGLTADFNKLDQLATFDLVNDTVRATSDECLDITLRTADWVTADYAPLQLRKEKDGDSPISYKATAQGHQVGIRDMRSDVAKGWMASPMIATDNGIDIVLWGSFLKVGGEDNCRLHVSFTNPRIPQRGI